jgi:isochorismate hydrolase
MTNLCCETTARDALMRDYGVFFLVDGTATGKNDHHLATLKNLGFGFAYLLTCDELIQNLIQTPSPFPSPQEAVSSLTKNHFRCKTG